METNGHQHPASEASRDFHGVLPPNRKIAKERSQHRLAAYLFSTGMSQTEIARKLGVTIATVSQWWRQPWMTQFVKEEMANGSRDVLNEIIKGAAVDSVFTLITLRDEKATPAAVKRQCCSELLDRAHGQSAADCAQCRLRRRPEGHPAGRCRAGLDAQRPGSDAESSSRILSNPRSTSRPPGGRRYRTLT